MTPDVINQPRSAAACRLRSLAHMAPCIAAQRSARHVYSSPGEHHGGIASAAAAVASKALWHGK